MISRAKVRNILAASGLSATAQAYLANETYYHERQLERRIEALRAHTHEVKIRKLMERFGTPLYQEG